VLNHSPIIILQSTYVGTQTSLDKFSFECSLVSVTRPASAFLMGSTAGPVAGSQFCFHYGGSVIKSGRGERSRFVSCVPGADPLSWAAL
jgi:hypothetical protein